jgi:hypothetical protein
MTIHSMYKSLHILSLDAQSMHRRQPNPTRQRAGLIGLYLS